GDMERALREKQFELHYQPILHLATGAVVGVEALVRWRHPEKGLLLPADFIPLAESTGAILPMGRWILAQACKEAARWAGEPDRHMAINLSAIQLMQPDFGAFVRKTLASSGVPAN